jgi:guanylate kinase
MKMSNKKMLIISGPSGVGKSTLIRSLLEQYPQFKSPVSATTRAMRDGEVQGVSYHFMDEPQFQQKIRNNEFLEWEEVYPGRYYGTLRSEYEKYLNQDDSYLVADIDVLGALNLKNQFGDKLCTLFVRPESTEALVNRLRMRGTDSETEIQRRKDRFEQELSHESRFDEVLVNTTGQVAQAKNDLFHIIQKHFNV